MAPDHPVEHRRPARSHWQLVAVFSVIYLVSQANLARIVGTLEPNIIVMQTRLTADAFWDVLRQWGPVGVARYRAHLPADLFHPFIYGAMGWAWVRRTSLFSTWPGGLERAVCWALPVAAGCDLIENAVHVYLLSLAPGGGGAWVTLGGVASSVKWLLSAAFAAALCAAGLAALIRRLRRRMRAH